MIFEDSVLHAYPLALIAGQKGLQINPVAGTPLAELVAATNKSAFCFGSDLAATDSNFSNQLCSNISVATTSYNDFITTHDGLVDGLITDIVSAVNNHISFAKNVVKPVVIDMAEKAQEFLKEQHDPVSDICIEVKSFPKPMTNAGFETSINKYDSKPFLEPEGQIAGGEMSAVAIMELMKTGSKEFDDDIGEWFINFGELRASLIWNNLFRKFTDSQPSEVITFIDIRNRNSVDDFLAIHLLARKLYDEVPEGIAMELKDFKNIVAQYRDWSGVALFEHYNKYNSSIKLKTLVLGIDEKSKKITVNEPVYKAWLETGGDNEVLMGLLVSGSLNFSQALIDERKEELTQKWQQYASFKRTANKNQIFNRFKDVLTVVFADEIKTFREEEQGFVNDTPNYAEIVSKNFREQLDKLVFKDMEDIFSTCLKLVCRARFYYTDAETILEGINSAVLANPKIDIREAALLSTIEYVCDFVCNQLTLSS